jgi:hypothetical protein
MEEYLKKKRLQCNKIGKMRFIRYYMEKPEIKKKRKRERKKKDKKLEEVKESQNNIRIQVGESQENASDKSAKNQHILSPQIPPTPNFAPQYEMTQIDNQSSDINLNPPIIPSHNYK